LGGEAFCVKHRVKHQNQGQKEAAEAEKQMHGSQNDSGLFQRKKSIEKAETQGKEKDAEQLTQGVAEKGENGGASPCPIAGECHHPHIKEGDDGKGEASGKGNLADEFADGFVHFNLLPIARRFPVWKRNLV